MIDPNDYMARNQIEQHYTKDTIAAGLFRYVKAFFLKDTDPDWQTPNTVQNTHLLLTKKSFTRSDMVLIAYSVLDEEEIYKAFLKSLPWYLPIAIEKMVWLESMTHRDLEAFLKTVADKHNLENPENQIVNQGYDFSFFPIKSDYYSRGSHGDLYIPKEMKTEIIKYYIKPIYQDFVPLAEIPETTYVYSAEKHIFEELPHIISYYLLGNIKFSASGRPVESTLAKFQKSCGIDEFYGIEKEKLAKVRSNLIAGMLYNLAQKDISTDSIELIKTFFRKHYATLFTPQFVLTGYKGWNFFDGYSDRNKDLESKLMTVLADMPLHDWMSIENLQELLGYRFINTSPLTASAAQSKLYYEEELPLNETKKHTINSGMYNSFITAPFLKGTLFLFAAFGLVEVAFDSINTDKFGSTYFSNYDGLKYFKLTALGAYIFGITSTYEPTAIVERTKLTLSNDSLLIIADGKTTAVTDRMLSAYSEKLGDTRYKVSAESFLKDCKNRKEIENKVALFKAIINGSVPTIWERFFKELLTNASAVKINKFLQTYSLPEEDKELHKIVAQDTTLKQLVLKAEGFNLLVPNENISKFKTRMKELGFIVE